MAEITENGILKATSTPEDRHQAAITLAEIAIRARAETDLRDALNMIGVP
ncbi:hypothetical protein KIH74_23040 [Kineosporia sp. J2-2]|uniref:Uncharacterized protein n=1 Tax=Kineosporia corallincola TaxID=2835133 RepID=A0ABS5TNQ8_9ACTN|nr:hypothetical protein [Kineosporia corallincola]MBT0771836.1 hypothetical protein [Kineosporia corallincola]